jgi:DNA-binding NtrC family response regulator
VRIVAATNRVLGEMVLRGEFREGLLYRLKVVEIAVPPLRARRSDLPDLVEWILPELCRRNHKPLRTLSAEATKRLQDYGWPGNVRELQNVLERAAILCEGDVIQASDLALPEAPPPEEDIAHLAALPEDADHRDVMESVEKHRLLGALKAAGGNQSRAARALGIARTTLINKMRRYGLT